MKMKSIVSTVILLTILSFWNCYSFAQESINKKINPEAFYIELGGSQNITNRSLPLYNLSVYGITKYGYGISANFQKTNRISRDKPENFTLARVFIEGGDEWAAIDKLHVSNIRALKSFQIHKKFRLVVELGVSHNSYKEAYFVPYIPVPSNSTSGMGPSFGGLFGIKSHDVYYNSYKFWGLSSKAKVDFQLLRGLGFSAGLTGNINKEFSYLSLDVSLMLGYVRAK